MRLSGLVLAALVAAALTQAGCQQGCTRNSDCSSREVCGEEAVCVARPDAGGQPENAPGDAEDAEAVDAGIDGYAAVDGP